MSDDEPEADVDVEKTDIPEEDEDDRKEGGASRNGENFFDLLVGLLTDLLRAVVDESVGHELSRFFASYEAARRRLRALGILALTVLVLLLLAAIVWLLVGVVFLADRFPATGDPLVFAVGIAVGYALAVIAGLVYN
jgi:hypothetical protein